MLTLFRQRDSRDVRAQFFLGFVLNAAALVAAAKNSPRVPNSLFSVQVEDLSPKLLDFYDTAVKNNASPDEGWVLWKEKYDYAAVHPFLPDSR